MKRLTYILLIIAVCTFSACVPARAYMDRSKLHSSPVPKATFYTDEEVVKTPETLNSSVFLSIQEPRSWTRFLLIGALILYIIKWIIAERARIVCNNKVKLVIMYYVIYKCDHNAARYWHTKHYRYGYLTPWEYLTVFRWKQLFNPIYDGILEKIDKETDPVYLHETVKKLKMDDVREMIGI